MGKPRLIILIRHAQSEGNKNRTIHQMIPDHRVKLTEEGWRQAEDAGHRLRHLLRPDDTLQVFTSPYRRTRETTEGILKTLTASSDPNYPSAAPSPFSRNKIKVYEEPRLREQDFGNFQPCSAEMERMWQERADYGHFFYRIPNGESAADAYDRVSGFNESLWRQFGEKEFPSVLVLVTHGLMTRIFLMKWYHWSVEYFEDLRNVNHCEFVLMKQNMESGKYVLESQLRTWSELKRQRAEAAKAAQDEQGAAERRNPSRRNTLSAFLKQPPQKSPGIPPKKWGGCADGCDHHSERYPTRDESKNMSLPPAAQVEKPESNEADDHALGSEEPMPPKSEHLDGSAEESTSHSEPSEHLNLPARPLPSYLQPGNGTASGDATPHEMPSDDEVDYFHTATSPSHPNNKFNNVSPQKRSIATAFQRRPERKPTPEDIERWANESGMGQGRHADALGDEPGPEEGDGKGKLERSASGRAQVEERLREQLEELEKAEERDKSVEGSVY